MTKTEILKKVESYYAEKIEHFGPTSRGVDWNSEESHLLRFKQLTKVIDSAWPSFSVLDYGCGFGSLYGFLSGIYHGFDYIGYDISMEMRRAAREKYGGSPNFRMLDDLDGFSKTDYLIANGIFNVKLDIFDREWEQYVVETIVSFDGLAAKGFAFNILTAHSDREYRRDHLYYADPVFYFEFCRRNFSRYVALLHDYPLYEFSILVKKVM